ncbi:thermonuclease family protein [Haloferula chungangensis]|uniref:Thermonuclease family protein n=1 Tax=Haloferula chungangensis TaxID=1048331 RepID=A0ABW2L9Y2_9BACT
MGVKAKQTSWPVLVLVILAFVLWLKDHKRDLVAAIAGEEKAAAVDGRYERFEGCHLLENRRNDGDSFSVKFPNGRVEEMRLYFVDAPESAFKSYGGGRNNHDRIADQGRNLGVSSERAVEIGVEAKRFVHDRLKGESFTVFTEWDDPFGDHRYHAFVEMPDGGWLHEDLVERGLVRIHTKGQDVPGGLRRDAQERHLKDLESEARKSGRGVWGR